MTGEWPTYNMVDEPWIVAETKDGAIERLGLASALLEAHRLTALRDPSPLVVASTHRLLVALLLDALQPHYVDDLATLLDQGSFARSQIDSFLDRHRSSFDLFASERPFLQSSDLDLAPIRGDAVKPVGYLFPEIPTATQINHFRHQLDDDAVLCPACAAAGLVTIPSFATSGGAGIRPSINGVPPLYILPAGRSLFESLVLSLVLPGFRPVVAADKDRPWWRRESTVVEHKVEVREVGFLDSLVFPARRVRLHPLHEVARCMRCAETAEPVVRTMVFQMGESRPKDAPFWFDPFAAYRNRDDGKPPVPIRPKAGKATWREFDALFVPSAAGDAGNSSQRPRILEQIDLLIDQHEDRLDFERIPFRCIGIRTDMKAKVFEWVDSGFEVPAAVIHEPSLAQQVRVAISMAERCGSAMNRAFRRAVSQGDKNRGDRLSATRERMNASYWSALAIPFRDFVLQLEPALKAGELVNELLTWTDGAIRAGRASLETALAAAGDDAAALRERSEGMADYRRNTSKLRQEMQPE